jgi:two-component system sensor histidine kinase KdpD
MTLIAQRGSASDELETTLLRALSHDLRTPLTAILAAGSALADVQPPRRERTELAQAIVAEAERLTALVNKLLDLDRIQAGATHPRRSWCAVDEVLYEAVRSLDPGGRRLSLLIAPDLPLVRADPAQLERAVANLIENALRYSAPERVDVCARLDRWRVILRVIDRGPGIPPKELTRIFEAFYRSPGTATAHSGSGLGLAIAKGFVEANGGRVWAESLPGSGTSFAVTLPITHAA